MQFYMVDIDVDVIKLSGFSYYDLGLCEEQKMWGSQAWNQWALQPAMFNDVPHEQIDWAELAKQWIQMQQAQPDGIPPPPPQIPPPISIPPPPGHGPILPEEIDHSINPPLLKTPAAPGLAPELFHSERPFEHESNTFSKSGDPGFWNKSQWNAPGDNDRLWDAPPPIEPAPILGGKETFDYGHMQNNAPLAMQTIDYNHMSDYPYNQIYAPPVPPPVPIPDTQYDQYWSQVNAAPTIAPIFLKKERVPTSSAPVEEETTHIDAAKRKSLPAWIRDGLEKMEQERLKRLEKERNAKEQAEKLSKADSLKRELNLKSPTSPFVPKSKFDSDSDEEQAEEPTFKQNSSSFKRVAPPIEDTRTEEEKKQDLMLKVRRTLTEVLLSVTNSEMVAIAQEVLKKAKSKAPARQLASTTSLTSVASGLRGLASYDSGSEASDTDDGSNSSDSEEELYRKMKEKKKLFAAKEKKIIAELERKELEDKTDREKINNGNISKGNAVIEIEEVKKESKAESESPSVMPFQRLANSNEIPFINEKSETEPTENNKLENEIDAKSVQKQEESNSSAYSSSSSETESNSSEMNRKKSYREKRKEKSAKNSKREKSPSTRERHHKHSKNKDSDSSDKHKRSRSPDRKSSNKKRKKSKRSDSSSSSSSHSHRKKSSSKHGSNHSRDRRSHSYEERRRRRSVSHSKSRRRSDGHSRKSSHGHRYHDDRYEKRYKEEKKYHDSKKSPSPFAHSSKLPRKYRSSRSPSSELEVFGKKSKKSRNH